MPNVISLLPSSLPQVTHDPTVTLNGDPLGILKGFDEFAITPEMIFSNVNVLLGFIDDATGLDLLALATELETLLGGPLNLLTGLLGFLTPGSTTAGGGVFGPLLGLIPGLGGGTGTLGGLGSFLNPTSFIGAAAGIFAPLLSGGSFLGGLIPGLDASKIVSGTFGASLLQPLINALSTGFGGSTGLNFTTLTTFLSGIPLAGAVIDAILNALGFSGSGLGLTDATNVFTDLFGIFGNPTGLGSGSPVLPGIGSIPLLGGLLSGGNILASIIPGLDASKITSGLFPISQITNLSTLLGGFGTSTSIITQLIGVIPHLTSGLTGLTGLTSIFTDITGLLGAPTALGSGSPVLPGIGSIPVLGGLLSGGNILGSIIPSLDASKITTGTLGTGLIPGLDVAKIVSGVFGTGFIPSLPASQITSGTLGSGLIPGLDASKITTGTFAETITGVNTLRDSFVKGFLNTATTGWTNSDAQNQAATVAAQAAAAATAAAQANATLAAQAAQQNSNNAAGGFYKNITPSGADAAALSGTDFASTGPTSGDLCIRGNNGYIGIKSSAATNTVGYYAILNYAFTTDNQVVEVALGDQGSYDSAYTTLYMHCDTSHTVGAYCSIGNGRIVIGSYTRSGGSYVYTPFTGGGNTYTGTIQSGMRVGLRNSGTTWSILINGNSVLNKVDSSVTFSAARRSAAVSMDRQHSSGFFGWGASDYDSFRIASISMADYVIPTYLGSGARINRTSTTQIAASSSGSQLLPSSFFGVTDKATADITVDLTNGKFTVANAGWYKIILRLQYATTLVANGDQTQGAANTLLYKNGSILEWGGGTWGFLSNAAGFSSGAGGNSMMGSFAVYLAAGDYVQGGYNNSAALNSGSKFVGEAAGVQTYFEIALLNRSTLY